MSKQILSEEFRRMQKLAGIKIISEDSRNDNKFTDFNEWIDAVTAECEKDPWYKTGKITINKNAPSDFENAEFDEMKWSDMVNILKDAQSQNGNIYDVCKKYGFMYNSDTGYTTIQGDSNDPNHYNIGCFPNGNIELCKVDFTYKGKWNNAKEEGVGPMTQQDAEKLSNLVYPPGSTKD